MPKEPSERRIEPRAHVELDIDLSTYGKYFLSKLSNVSTGGAFVRSQELHPVDTVIRLRFQLPGESAPIQAEGKVTWTYRQRGKNEPNSSGMGIAFTQIEDVDRAKIAQFIEKNRKR